MRYAKGVISLLTAAVAGQALAQDSAWGYFEAEQETKGVRLLQAGVVAEDGTQLILKCDEPGKTEVYVAIVSPKNLAGYKARPPERPIFFRYDDGPPKEARWFYYPTSVLAPNTKRNPLLAPFLEQLADASTLEVRLEPESAPPITVTFNVTGAREAVERVFENCKDENPLG